MSTRSFVCGSDILEIALFPFCLCSAIRDMKEKEMTVCLICPFHTFAFMPCDLSFSSVFVSRSRVVKERLGVPPKVIIGYQSHADTATKSGSTTKNKFVA